MCSTFLYSWYWNVGWVNLNRVSIFRHKYQFLIFQVLQRFAFFSQTLIWNLCSRFCHIKAVLNGDNIRYSWHEKHPWLLDFVWSCFEGAYFAAFLPFHLKFLEGQKGCIPSRENNSESRKFSGLSQFVRFCISVRIKIKNTIFFFPRQSVPFWIKLKSIFI